MELPQIKLGDNLVSRLIAGGNPVSGFSHISPEMDKEMADYHTAANTKALLDECLYYGINTFQARGDRHIIRILNEYRNEGKDIQWIAQTASEVRDAKANVEQIARFGAIAIYVHGTWVDNFWHSGDLKYVHGLIKIIRDTGLPVGLGTHRPDVLFAAEDERWGVDFYVVSLYNLAKGVKHVQAVEGFKEEDFDDGDCEKMLKVVRYTDKPCLVLKILGAGRKATSREDLRAAFEHTFNAIKPNDAVIVGMYQKHKNQVEENAEIVRDVLS